jgi:hypothetical protein
MADPTIVDIGVVEKLDPAKPGQRSRVLWSMVLLLAVKDMATVVRYEPFRGRRSLVYRVNGLYQDLMSPPRDMAEDLISAIESLIERGRLQRKWPLARWLGSWRKNDDPTTPRSLIELRIRDERVDAILSIPPTKYGRSVIIYLVDSSEVKGARSAAADEAAGIFRRMFEARERDPQGYDLPW